MIIKNMRYIEVLESSFLSEELLTKSMKLLHPFGVDSETLLTADRTFEGFKDFTA